MVRRVTGPWNAAALPEIMAGAVQESKRDEPETFNEGQAAGQQPSSAAGARGGGTAEARARPNVEVNRRAEGTSELNRRLGDGAKGDWALERCGAAGDCGWSLGGKQARRKASAEESKLDVPVPFHEGRAAGQQPGSVAGARGGGTAEARARPNVRAKRATTAGRQARAGENVPRTARPGLVACRWRSA